MKGAHAMSRRGDNIVSFHLHSRGRGQVLEGLFNEHKSSLRAFLRGRLRDYADVEDVLQDVFTRLAQIPDLPEQLTAPVSECRPYLITIAHNIVVDRERHKAIKRSFLETEARVGQLDVYEITPEVSVQGIQELDILEQAILDLPEKWQKAFVLSRFRHMAYKDIAQLMGVTIRTIENYIAKSIIRLRKAMDLSAGERL